MSEFDFRKLSLAGVGVQRGASMSVGKHVCRVSDAAVRVTSNKQGRQVEVTLTDVDSGASKKDFINVMNKNPTAERIGLERLKAIYFFGGHPDPDNAASEGVASLNGLIVGVNIIAEPYVDKDGNTKQGTAVGTYCDPRLAMSAPAASSGAAPGKPGQDLDDEIPF